MAAAEVEASRRGTRRIDPYVAEWFEAGEIPDIHGLAKGPGALGLLGMHLDGYGCVGMTEPDHGSDPGSMRTSAKRDGGDWVLNGSKMWITNGSVSQVAVIWDTDRRGHWGLRGANQHPWILGAGDQAQALTSRLGDERAGQGQSAFARRRGAS